MVVLKDIYFKDCYLISRRFEKEILYQSFFVLLVIKLFVSVVLSFSSFTLGLPILGPK